MSEQRQDSTRSEVNEVPFKAETRQILDILIHSLYTEREIFLRELISNASDALTRIDFETLTNREILDPEAELGIWIKVDEDERTLTITDTGIGMTAEELVENLGTIAHSGARDFLKVARSAKQSENQKLTDLIGQFGVGFYSVFMVAESVRVVSRSYRVEEKASAWFCTGTDTFTIQDAEKEKRGTTITVKLKEDASEFAKEYRLREIIRKHSDFIPFPIYLGESQEQANQRTALWRQIPKQVEKKDYEEFYKQLTLEFAPPLAYNHLSVDAPVQVYAILYIPGTRERGMFSLRKEDGLKLYARKVLIQEYCKDLLPEYFRFVQGVVDSEDLPLNVSRESVQSNRIMAQLKKLVSSKIINMIENLASEDPEKFTKFWLDFGRYIKQGIAIEQTEPEELYPLLRFHTNLEPDKWISLPEYVERKKQEQDAIYYVLGDDEHSLLFSPHLDAVRKHGYEVLLMADPVDPFMLVRLNEFQGHKFVNVAKADLKLPFQKEEKQEVKTAGVPTSDWAALIDRFKAHLGDLIADVRMTDRLADSPARLVDPEGAPSPELQRVYRLLKEEFEAPKKVLELNPNHTILVKMNKLPVEDDTGNLIIQLIYENTLLIDGLHQDPASMVSRIYQLIEKSLA
jgi:molecular chaperone HtpG